MTKSIPKKAHKLRMNRSSDDNIKKFYYLGILPATLIIFGWQGWSWWSWASAPIVPQANSKSGAVIINIPKGTSIQQIGENLAEVGLIRSSLAWRIWAFWLVSQRKGNFQAGDYMISPGDSLSQIADQIWTGKVVESSFTIPEGWSVAKMGRHFEEQGLFTSPDFMLASRQIPYNEFPWLPKNIRNLEGFLYPDTYNFNNDKISPKVVIHLMLKRFEEVVLPLYQKAVKNKQTKLSLAQIISLASLIEKEAAIDSERGLIAGVFMNRLQKRMKLESDPSVEYALGIHQTPDNPLTLRQIRVRSPYNTYLFPGLPIGPITNPGIASIQAAITPQKTDYMFFVAKYDGTHVFNRDLAAHEAAVKAIRQQRR